MDAYICLKILEKFKEKFGEEVKNYKIISSNQNLLKINKVIDQYVQEILNTIPEEKNNSEEEKENNNEK